MTQKYICDICSKFCSSKFHLASHVESCHLGCVYHCDVCSKQFSSLDSVSSHKRQWHNPTKSHTCEACGTRFPRYLALVEHLIFRHPHLVTDEQRALCPPMRCELCGMLLSRHSQLRRHMEARHAGVTVECEVCGQTFSCRHYLVRHCAKKHAMKLSRGDAVSNI
jgi:KRAB domain-containing zinc finger protein